MCKDFVVVVFISDKLICLFVLEVDFEFFFGVDWCVWIIFLLIMWCYVEWIN